ncbi:MAG TPA: ribosome biogenesis GTP-binding protein YsxC, partial [Clostridiales bacterium]|nr:ribosome biogenesis GTP-binding protein YsxC [Clostridiales bacterium]
GKSSVLNRLLNRKNFARVGDRPGKTIHINYFRIDDKMYFVDLPGYGYAAVSRSEKERWGRLMETFFADPEQIAMGVMIVDSRHKPTADDVMMADWFKAAGCRLAVAANKCDKLKKSEMSSQLALIRETLAMPDETPYILFSAEKGVGRDNLLGEIVKVL